MNTKPTLEQRISDALQPDTAITSADLAALIEETEVGIAKAEREGTVDQTLSLDPKAARQAIADAAFGADRLRLLLSKLQACYQQVYAQEQAKAWLAEYEVMKRERDALAKELREVYPKAANEIMDLFIRIGANNEALSELHRARPAGVMEHLVSAELHARGRDRFTRDTPSLLTSVCLFDFHSGRQAWPPPRPRPHRRSPHQWCQPITPPIGRTTTSGAPRRSSGSDSIWLTTMRARLGSKRSAKIERRGSVSLRASARTAPESPEACLRAKPSVLARPPNASGGAAERIHNRETSERFASLIAVFDHALPVRTGTVLCPRDQSNGPIEGDFEKGSADGAQESLRVISLTAARWRADREREATGT